MSEQDDVELDTPIEPTEEVVETNEVEVETPVEETEDLEKLKESNKRLFERTKKAEAELKELKKKPIPQTNTSPTDADELRLIAKGLSDEEIEQAKVISKGNEVSLIEAIKNPLFVAFQKDLKEQQRKEKAKLSASRGSSEQTQKSLSELSRDEHQKLAMEAASNIQ